MATLDTDRSVLVGMQPIRQLVKIKHGSHLYGTSTPTSDQDFKGVHLPSGVALTMQRAEEVLERGVVAKEGTKNTADAVDYQSYSLQKFLGMLAKGDTVATEILFAPPEMIIEQDDLWPMIQEIGRRLINREVKGFVGYCQRQAAKYGVKGSRMAAVKTLIDYLTCWAALDGGAAAKLGTFEIELRSLCMDHEHMQMVNIPSPNGADMYHVECCDRKMPMTVTLKEAIDVYTKVWDNYGARARAAMTNDGIDWKAISHAVRVARQALELLRTHTITFPRPDAGQLLAIKQGMIPYDQVGPLLEGLVAEVMACESTLPKTTDMRDLDTAVFTAYRAQLENTWRY